MQCAICKQLIDGDNYQKMCVRDHEQHMYNVCTDCLKTLGLIDT